MRSTNYEDILEYRVEHLFGFVENSMNGSFIHTIGIASAKAKIGMMNLTYNICRCTQLKIVVAMGQVCPDVKEVHLYVSDI